MPFIRRIPIRIHIWGGFGSQLFGYVTAERLKRKFPRRKIILLFHTSGVTKRELELPARLLIGSTVIRIDDFRAPLDKSQSKRPNISRRFRTVLIDQLVRIGILARLNSEVDFRRLRKWVVDVRGHYSNVTFTYEELVTLYDSLQITDQADQDLSDVTLHYRLGDLLELEQKGPISIERLASILNRIKETSILQIYSDSPKEALSRIKEISNPKLVVESEQASSLEVISRGCKSPIFIGTNSKLSVWIAVLKFVSSKESEIYMPRESFPQLEMNLPEPRTAQRILFY